MGWVVPLHTWNLSSSHGPRRNRSAQSKPAVKHCHAFAGQNISALKVSLCKDCSHIRDLKAYLASKAGVLAKAIAGHTWKRHCSLTNSQVLRNAQFSPYKTHCWWKRTFTWSDRILYICTNRSPVVGTWLGVQTDHLHTETFGSKDTWRACPLVNRRTLKALKMPIWWKVGQNHSDKAINVGKE